MLNSINTEDITSHLVKQVKYKATSRVFLPLALKLQPIMFESSIEIRCIIEEIKNVN